MQKVQQKIEFLVLDSDVIRKVLAVKFNTLDCSNIKILNIVIFHNLNIQ